MRKQRQNFTGELKAKVALEAIKGIKSANQIAKDYQLHPQQVALWKKQLLEGAPQLLSDKRAKKEKSDEDLTNQLYQQIGQLKVELDWLKKNQDFTLEQKRSLVQYHNQISLLRQCQLLGIARSTYYFKPQKKESEENLRLMTLIDQQYLKTPFYGIRRMTESFKAKGEKVNVKRIQRLMRLMGLEAIYPKKKLSKKGEGHQIYPYLLKGLEIKKPNQVWATDITYIPLVGDFVYLVAIIDWYLRYVVSWELSNTMENYFCYVALEKAFSRGKPDIFNSDQGSQFTSKNFTGLLKREGVQISMDGKGRVFDNIFVERLWRSVKYEEVYLKAYKDMREAEVELGRYFVFYNKERLHQSLEYKTPENVYIKGG